MKRHRAVLVSSVRTAMCLPADGRVKAVSRRKQLLAGLAERGAGSWWSPTRCGETIGLIWRTSVTWACPST